MKLLTCRFQDQAYIGVKLGNAALLPQLSDEWPREIGSMVSLIERGREALGRLQRLIDNPPSTSLVSLEAVELLAPIPRPRKNIMCLGWNYADHAKESAQAFSRNLKIPDYPVVFTKSVTTVNGPYADIPYESEISSQIDWEVELGVIVGLGGRRIKIEHALQHVFGYTVINDISARDIQTRHKQFFLGKSLDGSCPMGPWIVTVDQIMNPQQLDLRCLVNNQLKQDSNTRRQIFGVASIISTLSGIMTLEPGDLIATGTPSGVGFARNPPEFLKPGDTVECEIESIGRIKNRIVEASKA
jgi:2-keto-4-pentenoate hydratase/2-oxohepta-3-ene-1,7-dioic acid hydratase in catechol pathway